MGETTFYDYIKCLQTHYCSCCSWSFPRVFDAVLHLRDGKYALIEIKLGRVPLQIPNFIIVFTGTPFEYKREYRVFLIPIGCLKD